MSTRANITFLDQGKALYSVPISSDGYPSGIGPNLVKMLKKTNCKSIRDNKEFLNFANTFVMEERFIDYEYEVDVSEKDFKIAVFGSSRDEPKFHGTLDEFAAWIDKD
jgi:hypothetical protein